MTITVEQHEIPQMIKMLEQELPSFKAAEAIEKWTGNGKTLIGALTFTDPLASGGIASLTISLTK